jgi:hypothetical protein
MWRTLCAFTGGPTDIAEEDVARRSLAQWLPLLERSRRHDQWERRKRLGVKGSRVPEPVEINVVVRMGMGGPEPRFAALLREAQAAPEPPPGWPQSRPGSPW